MMQCSLDSRTAFRFSILFAGILLAKGRRTVSSWLRDARIDTYRFHRGSDQQARYATYDAPLLCDGTFGSWSGLDGHKQIVGAQQLHNNNGLFALPQAAPLFGTESLGLAAGQTMPALGRSQLADQSANIEAQAAAGADAVGTGTTTGTADTARRPAAQVQTSPQDARLTNGTDPLSVLGIVRRWTQSKSQRSSMNFQRLIGLSSSKVRQSEIALVAKGS